MIDEFKTLGLSFIFSISILIAVFAVMTPIAIHLDYKSCKARTEALGYNYEYGALKGCIAIDKNGKKVLLEQIREVKAERYEI